MAVELTTPAPEQTRARYPDRDGFVERDGVRIFYEIYGAGEPTVFLLPTWSIIHSRHWKMQIPYLARHCRVLTFDGRGNGRSDRPPSGYEERDFAADALAVMDATATERAVLVSLSLGAPRPLPRARDPGHRGRDHWCRPRDRPRRGDRRRPRPARGLRPRPARARSRQGQPAPARVRRTGASARALGARQDASKARALHLL